MFFGIIIKETMDKFGMYKRVVQVSGSAPDEDKPQTPREIGGMIKDGAEVNHVSEKEDDKNDGTANARKPMSHALRVFLENQAKHERISREIDRRNGQ